MGMWNILAYASFALGGAVFVLLVVLCVISLRRKRRGFHISRLGGVGLLFLSVFLLRFSVAAYARVHLLPPFEALEHAQAADLIADSFVHALQTFSMDEGYTDYLFVSEIFPGGGLALLYRVLVNLTNVCAPVVGGAIVLDMIGCFFPGLRYYWTERAQNRFIFSELNERSMILAASIRREHDAQGEPCTLVFLDTKPAGEHGALSDQAKAIGAYCFSYDMADWTGDTFFTRVSSLLPGRAEGMTYELVMGEDAGANMALTARLAMAAEAAPVRKGGQYRSVLLFSEREIDSEMVNDLNRRLSATQNGQGLMLVQVQEIRSAVLRLFKETPIFLPMTCGGYERFEILVIGSGDVAEEMLCQCWWFGQLLHPGREERIALVLHALTQTREEAEALEIRLRHRMPGAFAAHPEVFRFSFSGARSFSADTLLREDMSQVSCAMICFDSDRQTSETALVIQRSFGRREMGRGRPAGVYVAMRDDELAKWLQAHCEAVRRETGSNCHVRTFGTRGECLSYRAVFCDELLYYAAVVSEAYHGDDSGGEQSMLHMLRDSYQLYSSLALAVHCSAKLFSCGLLRAEDFPELTRARLTEAIEGFLHRMEDPALRRRMAMLEHERWCAYMQSIGFEAVSAEDMAQCQHGESYRTKSVALRLHPCLVQRSSKGFMNREDCDDRPVQEMEEWQRSQPDPRWDELDLLSWKQHQLASGFYREKGKAGGGAETADGAARPGLYQNYKAIDERLMCALMENMLDYLNRSANPFTLKSLVCMNDRADRMPRG